MKKTGSIGSRQLTKNYHDSLGMRVITNNQIDYFFVRKYCTSTVKFKMKCLGLSAREKMNWRSLS